MNFETWLTAWLHRHPVKRPASADQQRFTDAVMRRIRAAEAPQQQPAQARTPQEGWWPALWPQVALAGAGIALAVMVGLQLRPGVNQLAQPQQSQQVTVVLAESAEDDAQWLEHTMQLLDELEEDPALQADDSSEDEWLEELEVLDEAELAASS